MRKINKNTTNNTMYKRQRKKRQQKYTKQGENEIHSKSDCINGIVSENFKNGNDLLFILVSLLFFCDVNC